METRGPAVALATLLALATDAAWAERIRNVRTESGVDWRSAGVGGVSSGSGQITLSGVTGTVKKAYLYWHGIDRTADGGNGVYDNDVVSITVTIDEIIAAVHNALNGCPIN